MGRRRELSLALAAATRAPTAGLVAVLLTGEAGIGKSTLLSSAGAALRWRVWPIQADALRGRIPYAALVDALGSLPGVDSSFVVGLLREVRAAFGVTSADVWFARACEATTRLLGALTATGPMAIAIDDLDQLDEDSQALLAVCLRRLSSAPLAVLATQRAGFSPLLGELELTTIPLGPLEVDDLSAVISPILPAPPDAALAAEIHARADGNPFFATELARSLASGTALTDRHEALLRRVAPLRADTLTVAHALAVFRRVRLDQLDLLASVTGLPVADAFDELLRHNVITLAGEGVYGFSHALVADALYDGIGPARRRELHAKVAARMLTERARGLRVDLLELAWHVSESAQPGDVSAIAVLTEAARFTRPRAPERAAQLCTRVLELLPAGGVERAEVESIRCRALARASRPGEAIAAGFGALTGLPPGADRVHTTTALLGSLLATGRITEAIEVVDGEPSSPGLRAARALLLSFAGRNAEALAEARLAERSVGGASPAERVQVFTQLTMVSSMLNRHEHTAAYADRALAEAGSSTTLRAQALAVGASASALAGLVPDAAERLAQVRTLEQDLFRDELLITSITLDWLRGQWESALRGLSRVAGELVSHQQSMLAGAALAIELAMRSWRGELDIAARLAARPAPAERNMAGLHAVALADYLMASGEVESAERMIGKVAEDPAELPYGCVLLGRLVDLLLDSGRDARAALTTLTEVAGGRFAPWSRVVLLRATGLVSGDLDALRAAAREASAGELGFEWARAELALGLRTDDVTEELVRAYQAFAEMGAHGLRRTAGRRLRELGAKVPRARSRAAGLLTETEERIARLVRQGMRNREIAEALRYSPRSVEVYLSRIYAKLGVTSRLALARTLDTAERLG